MANATVRGLKFILGIMATCELRGTLKYRDGNTNEFTVKTENNIKSMITGVKKLNADISGVLTDLVLKERGNDKGDEQVDDEDDSDEEMEDDAQKKYKVQASQQPPAKRLKTLRP